MRRYLDLERMYIWVKRKLQYWPIVLKGEDGEIIRKEVVASLVDRKEASFLCGRQTLYDRDANLLER